MADTLLEVRELSKSFPGLKALDRVSLTVGAGEIVALVGQNGSGKSTLVKTLTGVHAPDPGGRIVVRGPAGETLEGGAAAGALHVIHQELGLVDSLSVVENLDLGVEHRGRWLLPARARAERERAAALIGRFGGRFDVRAHVDALAPGERTIVALARALAHWERPDQVLILDEPTAALHDDEVSRLFDAVRQVARDGAGVLFISHRLDEVLSLSDRVIALRDGRVVADTRTGELDHDALVRLIAGRDVAKLARTAGDRGEERLRVRELAAGSLRHLDLDVAAGEIVGLGGLLGSGREHACAAIFGAIARERGTVHVGGRAVPSNDPGAAIAAGMGYLPADRRARGAVMAMTARENLTLARIDATRGGRVDRAAERGEAASWAARVELTPPEPERALELFSGGNQQKVVLAKWLRLAPSVLLLDEPTQGVDVGAKAAVYRLVADAAAAGAAVLVASSDEAELSALCDRVVVLRNGRAAEEIRGAALSEASLVLHNLGLESEASVTGAHHG